MSIYDSTHTGSNDSAATTRAKSILTRTIQENFRKKGFKVTIKEEVPALFDKPYHGDLGILFRSTEQYDLYHFLIIEIDGKIGHKTALKDRREDERASKFLQHSGTITIRLDLNEICGREKLSELQVFNKIWDEIIREYLITPISSKQERQSEKNRNFAIKLKENSGTKCTSCDHPPHHHTLTGCHYRQTNKSKLKCNCENPYFISDA